MVGKQISCSQNIWQPRSAVDLFTNKVWKHNVPYTCSRSGFTKDSRQSHNRVEPHYELFGECRTILLLAVDEYLTAHKAIPWLLSKWYPWGLESVPKFLSRHLNELQNHADISQIPLGFVLRRADFAPEPLLPCSSKIPQPVPRSRAHSPYCRDPARWLSSDSHPDSHDPMQKESKPKLSTLEVAWTSKQNQTAPAELQDHS